MADPRGPAFNTPPVGAYGGGYLRVRQEHPKGSGQYRIVRVHESKLTPGQRAAAMRNGLNTEPAHGGSGGASQPATGAPAAPSTPTPTAPPTIDPRDGSYQNELARLLYERNTGIADITRQQQELPALYNRGAADITTGYNRDTYDSNANLAARGIVRSGEFQRRLGDRLQQRARQTADLERQYGTGAQGTLAARLNDINTQYNLGTASALQSAKDRYAANNPASTYIWANVG